MIASTETPRDSGTTLTSLVAGIFDDFRRLVLQQIDLFKAEIREDLIRLLTGFAFVAVGAGLALVGGLLLCFMCVYLLHELAALDLWLSFLIVGGVLLLTGATSAFIAYQRFRSFNPLPDQSITAFKENLQWKTNLK